MRPVTASPSLFGIELLAPETLHELLGVGWLGETVDVEPLVFVKR
jgi:hypothetical protein